MLDVADLSVVYGQHRALDGVALLGRGRALVAGGAGGRGLGAFARVFLGLVVLGGGGVLVFEAGLLCG